MNTSLPRRLRTATALSALTVLTLAACASPGTAPPGSTSAVTVTNCGSEVTLRTPAERIVLVNNDALPNLEALDAVDRIVAVTSALQPGLYADDTYATLGDLAVLSTEKTSTGGSVVSQESILGASPDLVIAPENAVDRAALAAAGIALYSPSAYCADPPADLQTTATFDRVWNEVNSLGTLLGESDAARRAIETAEATVSSPGPDAGTAAALYVSSGGGVLSPYGAPSMVTPVFAAAGLTNVYADAPERVFDAGIEDVISRDPGTVVLLYSGGDPQDTIDSFLGAPGVSALSAVSSGRVITLPFPYTDPPSMLSIAGPTELARRLAALG